MIKTRFIKIKGHPEGDVFHLDLTDPTGPAGRAINSRHQLRLEGIRALREACDAVLEKGAVDVELLESKSEGPYLRHLKA